ncbi:MAG TPA: Crp/Fnr family transcriptional regulator [Cytophagales bacterium]|nr:Crp/Fnr family transcriptional regulator [Cytophagales bacterium]
MHTFKKYIEDLFPISKEDWEHIASCIEVRSLKKGEELVRKGAKFSKEVFVSEGVLRSFLIDEEGNDKSTSFFLEGEFMSTHVFRTKNGHSLQSYQALKVARVLLLDRIRFNEIMSAQHLNTLGRMLKEKEKDRWLAREECLLQMKAKDKYAKFMACYPHSLENEISHRYIASYLGITPISLSRIRRKS